MEKLIITMTSNEKTHIDDIFIEVHSEQGTVTKKIFPSELANILGNHYVHKENIRIGNLPSGFIDASYENNKSFTVIVQVPASQHRLTYYESVYNVPLPSLIFGFIVKDSKLSITRLYAVKEDNAIDSTKLCRFPLANVSGFGDTVCWGCNLIPEISQIADVNRLVSIFLGLPFNDDNFNGGNSGFKMMRELLSDLQGRKEFPAEYLKEYDASLHWLKEDILTI